MIFISIAIMWILYQLQAPLWVWIMLITGTVLHAIAWRAKE